MKTTMCILVSATALLLSSAVWSFDAGRRALSPWDYGSNLDRKTILDLIQDKDTKMFHLVERRVDSQIERTVYSSDHYLSNAHWSCDGGYLAFLVRGETDNIGAGDFGQKLVIQDSAGRQAIEIPDVRRYRWSPFTSKIAGIIGDDIEGGVGFVSKTFFMYDIPTKEKSEFSTKAFDLYWAKHNNSIYLAHCHKNDPTEIFDPVRKVKTATSYLGIYFSPDGAYYYSPTCDGSLFILRKTENNETVQSHPTLQKEYLYPRGWLEGTNCLVVWDYNRRVAEIINVETGKSLEVNTSPDNQPGTILRRDFWGGTEVKITDEMINSLK
ncbi:MAG: hypothetical protein ABIH23_03805 [bacterium]